MPQTIPDTASTRIAFTSVGNAADSRTIQRPRSHIEYRTWSIFSAERRCSIPYSQRIRSSLQPKSSCYDAWSGIPPLRLSPATRVILLLCKGRNRCFRMRTISPWKRPVRVSSGPSRWLDLRPWPRATVRFSPSLSWILRRPFRGCIKRCTSRGSGSPYRRSSRERTPLLPQVRSPVWRVFVSRRRRRRGRWRGMDGACPVSRKMRTHGRHDICRVTFARGSP